MPRKPDAELSLYEALRLSLVEAQRRKLIRAAERYVDRVEADLAEALAKDPNYSGPESPPKKPRRKVAQFPSPLPPATGQEDDRDVGLELYCAQLLRVLARAPRDYDSTIALRSVRLPADQVDQICRQLSYLLGLRVPKPPAGKAA